MPRCAKNGKILLFACVCKTNNELLNHASGGFPKIRRGLVSKALGMLCWNTTTRFGRPPMRMIVAHASDVVTFTDPRARPADKVVELAVTHFLERTDGEAFTTDRLIYVQKNSNISCRPPRFTSSLAAAQLSKIPGTRGSTTIRIRTKTSGHKRAPTGRS